LEFNILKRLEVIPLKKGYKIQRENEEVNMILFIMSGTVEISNSFETIS
jgi:5-deoxy-D-glucuronate isomerase